MALRALKKGNYKVWTLDEVHDVVQIHLSPCATRVALQSEKSVKVLQLNFASLTSKEITTYHSDFEIEGIKWSPNSEALLVLSLQQCEFVVLQCFNQTSIFRVQEPNVINLASVEWAPDCQHLISVSSCNIFSFAHSLHDGRRLLLPHICSTNDCKPLLAFSYDGKYMALISFESSEYCLILMSTSTWSILWNKKSELIMIEGLEWSPNSTMLAVWDCSKQVSFFNINGEFLRTLHYDDYLASSYLMTTFAPESDLFVAACSRDKVNVILVFNLITWQLSAVLDDNLEPKLSLGSLEERAPSPILLENSFPTKSQLAFSPCGHFLATSMKRGHVIIWNVREGFEPDEVFNNQNCTMWLRWHSKKSHLAVAWADGTVFVWKCPQDGPVLKPATLLSVDINTRLVSSAAWSKSNIIITSLRKGSQKVVILIKNRKEK